MSPTAGQTISGAVTVQATATDDSGTVASMAFFIGGSSVPACTDAAAKPSGATFSCLMDTTTVPDGLTNLRTNATDPSGNTSAPDTVITVTIDNADVTLPANVQWLSPTAGQTISGTVTVQATATDDSGTVASMAFFIGGSSVPACTDTAAKPSGATFSCLMNTTTVPDGLTNLRTNATDPSHSRLGSEDHDLVRRRLRLDLTDHTGREQRRRNQHQPHSPSHWHGLRDGSAE